jgi:hypothetical protein
MPPHCREDGLSHGPRNTHPGRVSHAALHLKLCQTTLHCTKLTLYRGQVSGARRKALPLVIQIDVPDILAAGRARGHTISPHCEG